MCKAHFGDGDLLIDGFILHPVHTINEPFAPHAEVDFYLDTGKDCYLLRLRNHSNNTITLCKHDVYHHDLIYIVVEKPLQHPIREELEFIVKRLKSIDVPRKIYEEISFTAVE